MEKSEPSSQALVIRPPAAITITVDPQDERIVELWLHGRSGHTQRAYRRYAAQLFAYTRKPLRGISLDDLQAFASYLDTLALQPGSRHRVLSAVKSLFAFAARLQCIPFNTALPLRLPNIRDTLSERILDQAEVQRLIATADTPRNRLMLMLLYVAGVRVSELASLRWRDARPHRGGGQITVFGKGGKTRTIRLEGEAWARLEEARGMAGPDDPIVASRRGHGHLTGSQVLRIVKAAAKRAGIERPVSPHWLRHCHASHALDAGAPIHLVQATLGHTSVATTSRYLHARPTESSSRFLPTI